MIAIYILLGFVYLAIGAFLIGIYEDGDWGSFDMFYVLWFIFWPICLVMRYLSCIFKALYRLGNNAAERYHRTKSKRRK